MTDDELRELLATLDPGTDLVRVMLSIPMGVTASGVPLMSATVYSIPADRLARVMDELDAFQIESVTQPMSGGR